MSVRGAVVFVFRQVHVRLLLGVPPASVGARLGSLVPRRRSSRGRLDAGLQMCCQPLVVRLVVRPVIDSLTLCLVAPLTVIWLQIGLALLNLVRPRLLGAVCDGDLGQSAMAAANCMQVRGRNL